LIVTASSEHAADGLLAGLRSDLASAHAMILAQREMLAQREAALSEAASQAKTRALEIERLKLQLAKARHERFGQSSERGKLLVEQLELAIEDLEETQAEQETRAEISAPLSAKAPRRRPQRGPRKLPENLPVERVFEPAPCVCGKCGGARLRKLGEAVSKTLECEPRRRTSHRTRSREVRLSRLRGDHRAAGAVASDPARLRRPEPAGHDPRR
jgi:transposase